MHGKCVPNEITLPNPLSRYSQQSIQGKQSLHSSHSGASRIESLKSLPNSCSRSTSPRKDASPPPLLSFPIPTRSRMPSELSPSLYGSGSETQPRHGAQDSQSLHFSSSGASTAKGGDKRQEIWFYETNVRL